MKNCTDELSTDGISSTVLGCVVSRILWSTSVDLRHSYVSYVSCCSGDWEANKNLTQIVRYSNTSYAHAEVCEVAGNYYRKPQQLEPWTYVTVIFHHPCLYKMVPRKANSFAWLLHTVRFLA